MACRLFGAKPLTGPRPDQFPSDSNEQYSLKCYQKWKIFIQEKVYEMSSAKQRPSCLGFIELMLHILDLQYNGELRLFSIVPWQI